MKVKRNEIVTEVIGIEEVYKILNHVQVNFRECSFMTTVKDSFTVENILKDISCIFEKSNVNENVRFNIKPSLKYKNNEDHFMFEEEIEDELPEDGQCF